MAKIRRSRKLDSGETDFDEGLPDRSRSCKPRSTIQKKDQSKVEDTDPALVKNSGGIKLTDYIKQASEVPRVLTWEAVRKSELPKLGISGIDESLEKDVPPQFRFWKCSTKAEALRVREALVESELFTKDTIRKVDGKLRRVRVETFAKVYLPGEFDDSEVPEVPVETTPIEKAAKHLLEDGATLFPDDVVEAIGVETIVSKLGSLKTGWLVSAKDSEESRKILPGPLFKLQSRDDLVFATNLEVDTEAVRWIEDRTGSILQKALSENHSVPLLKADEERIVFGIVLEPDSVDAQSDTISAEEIEKACHRFMEHFGNLGTQHTEIVNDKLTILECYIAPTNFKVDGKQVKKGTWLLKERVVDDDLWESVKKGDYTGYSIGGSGVRKPA